MNGQSHPKTLLKAYPINFAGVAEAFFLLILGLAAMTAHARFKGGLHLPGHHGFEFMALMLIGKMTTKFRWSGIFFSVGALSAMAFPVLGFTNPITVFIFAVPGVVFDILSNITKNEKGKLLFFALFAGISYAIIPIIRLFLSSASGIIYKPAVFGSVFPILSHFAFALLGAAAGIGIFLGIKKITQK